MKKIYPRKCVNCKERFKPQQNTQICCSPWCAVEYVRNKKTKADLKKWNKEKKEIKDKLMTKSDYLNIAQKVFNTYIRIRDKGKPCISCDKVLKENDVNASHFFSVGAYPNLRFNEDNVHSSCIRCNKELHGNINEYSLRLPKRIGQEKYNQLLLDRNNPLKLDIEEVKELIKKYKDEIKKLKKEL